MQWGVKKRESQGDLKTWKRLLRNPVMCKRTSIGILAYMHQFLQEVNNGYFVGFFTLKSKGFSEQTDRDN